MESSENFTPEGLTNLSSSLAVNVATVPWKIQKSVSSIGHHKHLQLQQDSFCECEIGFSLMRNCLLFLLKSHNMTRYICQW